ncbi:YolD-like family protein [Alkalihalobacillus sp. LMS39]|uniref:YolD-like family protein n=1 Tax=Alkalihalobacillus sp. LMS39 TaxID=2924032 RepID=UPI001FB4E2A4|nr:YolD-like family protein [Alkalihalobacillus sp. LMS39]UOE96034.1 YolD-like family protein [Alkalihalobacillus sp. LMS39]
MNKDRGNIKWSAMMLPEHVHLLRQLQEEQEHEVKPLLDEQSFSEMNMLMNEALQNKSMLEICYFNEYNSQTIVGKIVHVNDEQSMLTLLDESEQKKRIQLKQIVNVKEV